mgnify:CR=1 FL=1
MDEIMDYYLEIGAIEISGVDKKNLLNLRAAVSYFSKKDGYRVATEHTGDTLTIERIRK